MRLNEQSFVLISAISKVDEDVMAGKFSGMSHRINKLFGYPQHQDSSFPSFPQPINGTTLDTGMHVDPHGWIVVRSKDISGSSYSWNVEVTNYAENGNQNGSRVYHCRIDTHVKPFPLLTTHDTVCT